VTLCTCEQGIGTLVATGQIVLSFDLRSSSFLTTHGAAAASSILSDDQPKPLLST